MAGRVTRELGVDQGMAQSHRRIFFDMMTRVREWKGSLVFRGVNSTDGDAIFPMV